jgi:hypothetical protein
VEIEVPDLPEEPDTSPIVDDIEGFGIAAEASSAPTPSGTNVYSFTGLAPPHSYKSADKPLQVAKFENSTPEHLVLANEKIVPHRDPKHFRVAIRGMSANQKISIEIETRNPDDTVCDDATTVPLYFSANSPGTASSPPMVLVTDTVDDTKSESTMGTDDQDEDKNAESGKCDLSHLAKLGGKVVISSITIDGKKSLLNLEKPIAKPLHTLRLNIVNFTDSGVSAEQIEADIRVAAERLAQVGVNVERASPQNPIHSPAPPFGIRGSATSAPEFGPLSGDERLVIDDHGTNNLVDDIHVFYCKTILNASDPSRPISGFTRYTGTSGYFNNVFMSGTHRKVFTLAHEIGHLLTRKGHYGASRFSIDYKGNAPAHLSDYNLMREGTSQTDTVGASKRLYLSQEKRIWSRKP